MEKELNWAVIGTGVIANEMAQALLKMDKKLYGVANRTQAKAIDFAKKYGVKKVYDEIYEKGVRTWKAFICRKINYVK